MNATIVKRPKNLTEIIESAPIGQWLEIKNSDYKTSVVRVIVSTLRKKGRALEATEVGCYDSIKVRRLS